MQDTPKQCKLLGATVRGLGLVVAVSSTLPFCYAVVEGTDKSTQLMQIASLTRDEIVFSAVAQPYETSMQRVAYGIWDEVHNLVPAQPVVLALAA